MASKDDIKLLRSPEWRPKMTINYKGAYKIVTGREMSNFLAYRALNGLKNRDIDAWVAHCITWLRQYPRDSLENRH